MGFSVILNNLLKTHNITAYRLAKNIGTSPSLVSYWVRGKKKPSFKNLQKLADYFKVSTDYLQAGEKSTKNAPANQAEAKTNPNIVYDDESMEILEEIRNRPGMRALFKVGKKVTPNELKQVIKLIETFKGEDSDE